MSHIHSCLETFSVPKLTYLTESCKFMICNEGKQSFSRLDLNACIYRTKQNCNFVGLYDNDVPESILERREASIFTRGRNFDTERRFCRKNLGPRHVFCKRQKQVNIKRKKLVIQVRESNFIFLIIIIIIDDDIKKMNFLSYFQH